MNFVYELLKNLKLTFENDENRDDINYEVVN